MSVSNPRYGVVEYLFAITAWMDGEASHGYLNLHRNGQGHRLHLQGVDLTDFISFLSGWDDE